MTEVKELKQNKNKNKNVVMQLRETKIKTSNGGKINVVMQ